MFSVLTGQIIPDGRLLKDRNYLFLEFLFILHVRYCFSEGKEELPSSNANGLLMFTWDLYVNSKELSGRLRILTNQLLPCIHGISHRPEVRSASLSWGLK
jgi:hypothetical protein